MGGWVSSPPHLDVLGEHHVGADGHRHALDGGYEGAPGAAHVLADPDQGLVPAAQFEAETRALLRGLRDLDPAVVAGEGDEQVLDVRAGVDDECVVRPLKRMSIFSRRTSPS